MEDRLPRRLAAILYADVVGYSRLTGEDEDATHRTLREYLDLTASTIKDHRGEVMHYAGDAVLAEFDAALDAMSAAVAIQNELRARNQDIPEERKIQFRIGVNSGDVIEDRGDIYGDGVNVAARLEALAEPGGICVSAAIRGAVGRKLDLVYEDMGEQLLKNIAEPVRASKVLMDVEPRGTFSSRTVVLDLPDKPSIAVLPFTNLSEDSEQEYFGDGITEDVITELSRFRELFVIARNSTFVYKNQPVDVNRIRRELRVRYVLEGSVRKGGERIRVTAQLVDANTGGHLWADRFDRELVDVFAIQDEITIAIVTTVSPEIGRAEYERIGRKRPESLNAWDNYQRAMWHLNHYTKEGNRQARRLFRRAIELDATCARAYQGIARAYLVDAAYHFGPVPGEALVEAKRTANHALWLDEEDAAAHGTYGRVLSFLGRHEEAVREQRKAIELNPNLAEAYYGLGLALHYSEQPEQALENYDTAVRLSPRDPFQWRIFAMQGWSCYVLGRYEEALDAAKNAVRYLRDQPEVPTVLELLVATEAQLGRIEHMAAAKEELLRNFPDYSIANYMMGWLDVHCPDNFVERAVDGLRKAGLPE